MIMSLMFRNRMLIPFTGDAGKLKGSPKRRNKILGRSRKEDCKISKKLCEICVLVQSL